MRGYYERADIVERYRQESEEILKAAGVPPESRYVIPSFTAKREKVPVARVFPKSIREALVAASQVDRLKGPGESMARTLAVDTAVRRAKRSCPGLFINPKEY